MLSLSSRWGKTVGYVNREDVGGAWGRQEEVVEGTDLTTGRA